MQTSWYQKPMASERLVNFCSKHPKRIILNTDTNFIRRVISDIEYSEESAFPWTRLLNSTIILVYIETKKKSEIKYTYRCYTFQAFQKDSRIQNVLKHIVFSLDQKTLNIFHKIFTNLKWKIDAMDMSIPGQTKWCN